MVDDAGKIAVWNIGNVDCVQCVDFFPAVAAASAGDCQAAFGLSRIQVIACRARRATHNHAGGAAGPGLS